MPRISKTWQMGLGLGKSAVSRYYIVLSVVTVYRKRVLSSTTSDPQSAGKRDWLGITRKLERYFEC